jgi:putative oxidoreductase
MKITVIIFRVLAGLLLLFASVVYLFKLVPQPELEGGVKAFMEGVQATTYLMPMVKVIELICALAFLSGRFVPLATVVIFPITLNIVLFHAFLAPEGLPTAIFLLFANLLIAFYYRKNYTGLMFSK